MLLGVAAWVVRWLALEIAMRIAQRRPRPTASPKDLAAPVNPPSRSHDGV